jgi:hypothetical protein
MRHAPDPGQGFLFAPAAEPEAIRRAAADPNIAMANHAYVRADARTTSAAAAGEALPKSGTQRAKVLEAIGEAGLDGLTDQEIAVALGLAENSVRPRRRELSDPPEGLPCLIFRAGTRPTAGGNPPRCGWPPNTSGRWTVARSGHLVTEVDHPALCLLAVWVTSLVLAGLGAR